MMGKTFLTFVFDYDNGEGFIDPRDVREIAQLTKESAITAADCLQDVIGELTELYNAAVTELQRPK